MHYEEVEKLSYRYSFARVCKLYKEIYGLNVVPAHVGYKANRYDKYKLYNLTDANDEIILRKVTLKALGDFLRSKNEY